MATLAPLARCPAKACPVRYTTPGSTDHLCAEHSHDDWAVHVAARELGVDLGELASTAPGAADPGRMGTRDGW